MSVTFCLQRIPVILASVGIAATALVAPAAPTGNPVYADTKWRMQAKCG